MCSRFPAQLLKKEGTIFLHIDSHMYAHLRLLMDDIFGENNFLNEIIWAYQTGGRARTYFPRKHDVILFYRQIPLLLFQHPRRPGGAQRDAQQPHAPRGRFGWAHLPVHHVRRKGIPLL